MIDADAKVSRATEAFVGHHADLNLGTGDAHAHGLVAPGARPDDGEGLVARDHRQRLGLLRERVHR